MDAQVKCYNLRHLLIVTFLFLTFTRIQIDLFFNMGECLTWRSDWDLSSIWDQDRKIENVQDVRDRKMI